MKTVLFDMDGTLTEPRKKITYEMVSLLDSLSKVFKIGIVTGSGLDYVKQQCNPLWEDLISIDLKQLSIMPCNGTQLYTIENGNQFKKHFSVSMREELGEPTYQELVRCIMSIQSWAMMHPEFLGNMLLTGHFVSYRESLLNWCPIGRNSTENERTRFISHDTTHSIRENLLKMLISRLTDRSFPLRGLRMALGGSTSIDLYPAGWDKTYSLKHVDTSKCYFIGDRCTGKGNDREIYEKIKSDGLGAYEVSCPEDTMKLIVDKFLKEGKDEA